MKAHCSTGLGASRHQPLHSHRDVVRRLVSFTALLVGLAAVVLTAPPAGAQTAAAPAATATITGQVLDGATGNFLEGADVTLQGTDRHVATARGGSFELTGLADGEHTLVVSYVGLATKTVQVFVSGGSAAPVLVTLNSEIVQMSAYKVTGMKEGMSQAVALQKVSIQSKMVAAADQFGPVSEGNIGEYLKFMPGVSIDYNVNDARGISLRGLGTQFTIVAVDGTPMAGASSTDDTRRFEFEQIAMNNVATTELYKTVTADVPATATGGFVNFVTKSAFDIKEEQRITYDFSLSAPSTNLHASKQTGLWGSGKEWTIRPSLEANVSRKITAKLGINVNYRFSEKYDDSPRTEFTWNTGTTAPTVMSAPRLQQYNIRQEEKLTHREAFATKLDYNFSDHDKLMLTGQWNWYDLDFTQRGPQFVLGTASTGADGTYTSGTGSQISNNVLYREKYGTTWHFNGRYSHEFENKSELSITPYWSRSDSQYRDTAKGFISTNSVMANGASTFSNFTLTGTNNLGVLPSISLVQGATAVPLDFIRNLGNYTLSNTSTGTGFQSRPWTAIDEKNGARADYKITFDQWRMPLTFMTGIQGDSTNRSINRPDFRGTVSATTGAALVALQDTGYTKDVGYGFGSYGVVDPYKVWANFSGVPMTLNVLDTRDIEEKNKAGYIRADLNVLSDLVVVGGVRYEKREIAATARTGNPTRARTTTANLDFDSLYPSLSFKYTPKRDIVVRGGFAQTIGIPDYGEMLPTFTVPSTAVSTDGVISVPSAHLKPYKSNNFDLSLDYYLKNSGVISVSFFYKDVKDFIISRGMTAAELAQTFADYGLTPSDYGVTPGTVKENGSRSSIQGMEISYAQNLTMLPAPFNGLSVQANFTVLDIDTKDADPYRALDTLYSQLRAVAPKTANVVLGYRYQKFNTTLTSNWVSESLYGGFVNTNYFIGTANTANPAGDTRLTLNKDEKFTMDLKMEYALNQHASVYFLVRNLTNSARKEFLKGYLPQYQTTVLPYRYFEFGEPHLTVGVRGTF
jgi:TonB-dependent receptor